MFRISSNQNLTSYLIRPLARKCLRKFSECCSPSKCPPPPCCEPCKIKVTICGANGQLGQALAFLLKQSPLIDVLSLYDMEGTVGVGMDLSHVDTRCRVEAYAGCCEVMDALINSSVVLVCAGVGRQPGMSFNELFEYNAPVVKEIAEACIKVCPKALLGILTNPINSFVPMVSKIYRQARCYDPNKIFGLTSIDTMRASTIVTRDVLLDSRDPGEFLVPVVGGHSPETMVPVLSQTTPCMEIPNDMIDLLIEKIRCASSMVVDLKRGHGGPRLSSALAATRFANNLIRGLKNEKDVVDVAYVYTDQVPGVCYFSTPIELGPWGMRRNLGLIKIDEEIEKPYLKEAIKHLKCDIKKGEDYVQAPPHPCEINQKKILF